MLGSVKPGSVPVNWRSIGWFLAVSATTITVFSFIAAFGSMKGERDARLNQAEAAIDHDAARLDALSQSIAGLKISLAELTGAVRVLDERSIEMRDGIRELRKAPQK